MISPFHLSQQSRDELRAVAADYRAMNQARRDKREEDEARNLLSNRRDRLLPAALAKRFRASSSSRLSRRAWFIAR